MGWHILVPDVCFCIFLKYCVFIYRQNLKSVLIYEEKIEDSYSVTLMPCRHLLQQSETKWAEDFALQVKITSSDYGHF